MEILLISKFNRRFLLMDLLLCSLWALFVFRIWSGNVMTAFCVRENLIDWWTVPFVLYVVMLRLRVSIMMYRNDKHGLWASLLLIPASIVSSNNNVKRLDLLEVKYNLTGVMKVKNSLGHIGLRDLYRMIIPAEYSDIQDYELPYLKVKKGDYWGVCNTQYVGFVKGNYDYAIIGYDIKPYEDMCFQVKPEYVFLEPMEDISKFRYKREVNDTLSYGELISE